MTLLIEEEKDRSGQLKALGKNGSIAEIIFLSQTERYFPSILIELISEVLYFYS